MGTTQSQAVWGRIRPVRIFIALALLSTVGIAVSFAQADDQSGQPSRAIRLSYVDGKVQLSQGGQLISDHAVINTPLMQGMSLTTAEDGKAEIQLEDGSVARIAPNSILTLTTLSGSGSGAEADLTVEHGEAYFELQGSEQAGVMRVHFGESTVQTSGFSVLRVQYDTPPGAVAVFSGNAHLERGNSTFLDLSGGESLALNNDSTGYSLTESIPSDSWDAWNSDRDNALNAEMASQTNAPGDLSGGDASNPAWSDLDASGSWYNVPGQGYVWSPYEAANATFDPYGYGNWVWTPGFGYTWASSYSWGYLPFSCGVWNFYGGFGWGWAPGYGGCTPWWSIGTYVGPAFGFTPGWYRTIHRPDPPRQGPYRGHPVPMIAVVRHEPGMGEPLPPRDRSTPVSIGGATVIGMRPYPGRVTPRPGVIVRGTNAPTFGGGLANRPVFITPRNGYTPPATGSAAPTRPGNVNGPQQSGGFRPAPQPGRVFPPPIYRGYTGPGGRTEPGMAPAPTPAPAPVPRVFTPPPTRPVAPSSPTPSRPINPGGGNPGGGFHPSPAPNPGGGGGFHGGGAPSGGAHGGGSAGGHR